MAKYAPSIEQPSRHSPFSLQTLPTMQVVPAWHVGSFATQAPFGSQDSSSGGAPVVAAPQPDDIAITPGANSECVTSLRVRASMCIGTLLPIHGAVVPSVFVLLSVLRVAIFFVSSIALRRVAYSIPGTGLARLTGPGGAYKGELRAASPQHINSPSDVTAQARTHPPATETAPDSSPLTCFGTLAASVVPSPSWPK